MRRLFAILLILCVGWLAMALPAKPNPERLVNDRAGLLSSAQLRVLEDSLTDFALKTSSQVVVLTVNDLEGYDVSDFAYRVFTEWGIGQKGKNNGVIMVVKPKRSNNDRGQAFILTGYGLEGALPDVLCSRIVRDEMIPYFKTNDYAGGIKAGVMSIMKACRGEYTADDVDDDGDVFLAFFVILAIMVLVFIVLSSGDNNGSHMSSGTSLSDAMVIGSLFGRNSGSDWGSFSGGSGSFGGFGGFGGGLSGGGGGGGSW